MKPRILVPFDFSESAEQALAWAADLRRTTGADPLQLVHAITKRPPGSGEVPLATLLPNDDETASLQRSMIEAAQRHDAPATAEVAIRPDTIGNIIVDAGRSLNVDLIVMGTQGRTGMRRLVMGSVAEHVLRHADCPVVTVKARRHGDAKSELDESRRTQ
jgi:nucleotide-binding universal stress UspA family protein